MIMIILMMKVLIVKRKKRATWTSWKGKWRCKAISLPLEEAGKAWVLLASLTVWKIIAFAETFSFSQILTIKHVVAPPSPFLSPEINSHSLERAFHLHRHRRCHILINLDIWAAWLLMVLQLPVTANPSPSSSSPLTRSRLSQSGKIVWSAQTLW